MQGLPEMPAAVTVGDVGADESFREMSESQRRANSVPGENISWGQAS